MANTPVAEMADSALKGVALNPSTTDEMRSDAIDECETRGIDLGIDLAPCPSTPMSQRLSDGDTSESD